MARDSNRQDRVADLLKKELALLIQSEIRDPRIGMVSVTGVKVSRDMAYADIYITILAKSEGEESAEGVVVLNRASGYLRSLLAKNVNLRTTPKLKFIYDESIARGQYLSSLIDEAISLDRNSHSSE